MAHEITAERAARNASGRIFRDTKVGREHPAVDGRAIAPSLSGKQEDTVRAAVKTEMYLKEYAQVFEGDQRWRALPVPEGNIYAWDAKSTYIKRPPFFDGMPKAPAPLKRSM